MNIDTETLRQHYQTVSDEELLSLSRSQEELTESAIIVLQDMIAARGLTSEHDDDQDSQDAFHDDQYSQTCPSYKGIGGWLLFLCLSLTFLGPLLSVRNIVMGYQDLSPYFSQIPRLSLFTGIYSVLSVGMVGWAIFAGTSLWRVRPQAISITKLYFLGLVGFAVLVSLLPYMSGLSGEVAKTFSIGSLKTTPGTLLYVVIWYTYLNRSKRVKATFALDY